MYLFSSLASTPLLRQINATIDRISNSAGAVCTGLELVFDTGPQPQTKAWSSFPTSDIDVSSMEVRIGISSLPRPVIEHSFSW